MARSAEFFQIAQDFERDHNIQFKEEFWDAIKKIDSFENPPSLEDFRNGLRESVGELSVDFDEENGYCENEKEEYSEKEDNEIEEEEYFDKEDHKNGDHDEILKLKDKIHGLEQEYQKVFREKEQYMTLLNSVEEDYDKKYNKIEKEKREVSEDLKKLKEEYSKLVKENKSDKLFISELEEALKNSEQQNQSSKDWKSMYEQLKNQHIYQDDSLREEEINKLKDEIIQLTKRVETTTCNLNVKKEQYDKLLKSFEELEKEKKEMDSRNEQLKKEIDTLRKRLRDHFDEYHVEPDMVEVSGSDISPLSTELKPHLQFHNDSIVSPAHDEEKSKLLAEISHLKQALEHANKLKEEKEGQLKSNLLIHQDQERAEAQLQHAKELMDKDKEANKKIEQIQNQFLSYQNMLLDSSQKIKELEQTKISLTEQLANKVEVQMKVVLPKKNSFVWSLLLIILGFMASLILDIEYLIPELWDSSNQPS